MEATDLDLIRNIVIAAISLILLAIFKKRISKVVTDVIVGGDSTDVSGKSMSEIREEIESMIDRVVK